MRTPTPRESRFVLLCVIGLAGASVFPFSRLSPQTQKANDVPRIEIRAGQEYLVLPVKLSAAIEKEAPRFRVPGPKDRSGNWDQDTEAGNLPYAVWGDFNGDGRTDVALILLGNKEWKLTIFHQTEAGFRLVHSTGSKTEGPDAQVPSAQVLSLKLVPRGKPYVYTTLTNAGRKEKRYNFEYDAIEFSAVEQFLSIVYWKAGKYEVMSFGD